MQSKSPLDNHIWKDVENYLQALFADDETIPQHAADTVNVLSANAETAATAAHEPEQQSAAPELREATATGRDFASSASANRNVDEIKRKYIVGKISGKDIRDNQGQLIIAQNAVITEEVVDLADQNGKLVELIVNMTIQY